jgi:two-component system nitrogen regulation response regulator GlnG
VLIRRALAATHGRRIEAARLLGLGRNTITRKIQELGLDDAPVDAAP